VELKAYVWLDVNYVSVAKEMTHSLSADDPNTNVVDIGTVSRF
jgi:hypothetical protein